jgi:hypothetical protein
METKNYLDEEYNAQLYKEQLEYEKFIANVRSPIYSKQDIASAIRYASKSITITPSEVGKQVYDELHTEKILEFLSNTKS